MVNLSSLNILSVKTTPNKSASLLLMPDDSCVKNAILALLRKSFRNHVCKEVFLSVIFWVKFSWSKVGEPLSWRCEGLGTSWQSTRLIFGLPQLSPLLTTHCIALSVLFTVLQVVLSAQCSVHRWLRAAAGCSLLSHTTTTTIENVNMTHTRPSP